MSDITHEQTPPQTWKKIETKQRKINLKGMLIGFSLVMAHHIRLNISRLHKVWKKIATCITYPWIVFVYRLFFLLWMYFFVRFFWACNERKTRRFYWQTKIMKSERKNRPETTEWKKFFHVSFSSCEFFSTLFLCLVPAKPKQRALWRWRGEE